MYWPVAPSRVKAWGELRLVAPLLETLPRYLGTWLSGTGVVSSSTLTLAMMSLTLDCCWPGGPCSTRNSTCPLALNFCTSVATSILFVQPCGTTVPNFAVVMAVPLTEAEAVVWLLEADGVAALPQAVTRPQATMAETAMVRALVTLSGPRDRGRRRNQFRGHTRDGSCATRPPGPWLWRQSSDDAADRRTGGPHRGGGARAAARERPRPQRLPSQCAASARHVRPVVVRLRRHGAARRGPGGAADGALRPRPGGRLAPCRGHPHAHPTAPHGRTPR